MTHGKAITLFLIDGAPDGRIACELFNWTGKGYKIPRTLLKESASRMDLKKAGVYFLFGRDETSAETNRAYIGEAEEVFTRITQHQKDDFWNEILLFVSKDENLNKAHVKYLEFKIFQAATQANRFVLENGNTPPCPAISESEQAVMSEFFENLKLLVGTMGYKIFEPLTKVDIPFSDNYAISAARGANARAVMTNEGMVVLKASEVAASTVASTPEHVLKLRQALVDQKVLVDVGGKMIFAQDHLFSSPSTAAAVVMGRGANGLIEWKDSQSKTLKENQE